MKRASKSIFAGAGASSKPSASALPVFARLVPAGLELKIVVIPGARTNEIVGEYGDRLKLKVQAPPEKGKANDDVCDLLRELTGKKGVEIVAGLASREKIALIPGLTEWAVAV
jgi:uncharacterized protein